MSIGQDQVSGDKMEWDGWKYVWNERTKEKKKDEVTSNGMVLLKTYH